MHQLQSTLTLNIEWPVNKRSNHENDLGAIALHRPDPEITAQLPKTTIANNAGAFFDKHGL